MLNKKIFVFFLGMFASTLAFLDPDRKSPKHDAAIHFLSKPEVIADMLTSLDIITTHPPVTYANATGKLCTLKTCRCAELCTFATPPRVGNIITKTSIILSKRQGKSKQTIGFLDGILSFDLTWKSEPHLMFFDHQMTYAEFHSTEFTPYSFCHEFRDKWEQLPTKAAFKEKVVWVMDDGDKKYIEEEKAWGVGNRFQKTQDATKNEWCKPYAPQDILTLNPYLKKVRGWARNETATTNFTSKMQLCIETKVFPTSIAEILEPIQYYRKQLNDTDMKWCVVTFFDLDNNQQQALEDANVYWIRMGPRFEEWWEEQQQPSVPKRARCIL